MSQLMQRERKSTGRTGGSNQHLRTSRDGEGEPGASAHPLPSHSSLVLGSAPQRQRVPLPRIPQVSIAIGVSRAAKPMEGNEGFSPSWAAVGWEKGWEDAAAQPQPGQGTRRGLYPTWKVLGPPMRAVPCLGQSWCRPWLSSPAALSPTVCSIFPSLVLFQPVKSETNLCF